MKNEKKWPPDYDTYYNGIYPRPLWVAAKWDDSLSKVFRWPDGGTIEEPTGTGRMYAVNSTKTGKGGVLVVFNIAGLKLHEKIGVAVHESVHTANTYASDMGYKLDPDNDEPMAYLVEWITECCVKTLEKNKLI